MNAIDYHEAMVAAAYDRVVNMHTDPSYDHYIGRPQGDDEPSKWANPYTVEECGNNRELCVIRFLGHAQRVKLYEHTHELKGQRLGCHCAPHFCHGHPLARLSIEPSVKTSRSRLQLIISRAIAQHAKGKRLKVAVSGSRKLTHELRENGSNQEWMEYNQDMTEVYAGLRAMPWVTTQLHHGGCAGVDMLAEHWAKHSAKALSFAHPVEDWSKGTWQGPARSKAMLDQVEAFAAFWDGKAEKSGTLAFVQHAWDNDEWICWQVPVQSHRIVRRFYGIRWRCLF